MVTPVTEPENAALADAAPAPAPAEKTKKEDSFFVFLL